MISAPGPTPARVHKIRSAPISWLTTMGGMRSVRGKTVLCSPTVTLMWESCARRWPAPVVRRRHRAVTVQQHEECPGTLVVNMAIKPGWRTCLRAR